jgi:hypothetical protein
VSTDSAGNPFEEFDMVGGERIRVTLIEYAAWASGPTIRVQKRMESGQLAPGPEFPARLAGSFAKALADLLAGRILSGTGGATEAQPSSARVEFDARLYQRLVEAAKARQLVAYSELEGLLGLDMDLPNDRKRVGELLGEISRYEVQEGRPMLSSVVWHKDMSGPGRGFFNLGVELGRVRGSEDELAFATRELNATYDAWGGS